MKKQRIWIRRMLIVPLMFFFIVAVYSFEVPNPMIILIIPVVYFTYSDGYISGTLSGATAILYAIYFFLVKTNDPAGGYKVGTIVLAITAIIVLVGKLKAREEKNITELKRRGDALVHMATTDKLTGASNRHAFFDIANTICENSRQFSTPVSLLFIDIDHFKQINDQYGHGFGDAVLSKLSDTLLRCLRSSDVNCRYGGEEFVLLLSNANGDAAQLVAHRIMEQVREMRFEEHPDFRLTVSIGVSSMVPSAPPEIDLLIRSADNAMYRAKQTGRDRIVVGHLEQSTDGSERPCHLRFVPISCGGNVDASEEENYLTKDILLHAIDQMLELVYVVDTETYELLYINSAGREKYGIGDIHSARCYQLMQGLDEPCSFCLNDRLNFDSVYTWEFTNKMLGRHFLLRDRLVHWNGRKARMQIATDITEQEDERNTLKNLLEAERVVRECVRLLYKTECLDDAMGSVLRCAGEYLGADRAYFFLLSGDTLVSANEWCASQLPAGIRVQKVKLHDFNRLWSLFGNKECVIIEDIEQMKSLDVEVYQAFSRQEIKNVVFIPLEQDGNLLGLWGMDNPSLEKVRSIAPLLLSLRYFLLSTMKRIEYEERLVTLSFEDSLTGLRNRNCYLQDIANVETVKNTGVVYITINEMKNLNDTYGHDYGDQILTGCADRIKETYPSGIAYRVGGDEFVVICRDVPQEQFEQHVQAFKANCTVSQDCHAAIGYHWAEQGEDIQGLIHKAEAWMYQDKKGHYRKSLPSDRYRHYNDDVFCLTEPGSLKKSLAEGRFLIYLQPKISFSDRRVSGAEALVRYRQEDGEIITPAQFLPVLEDAKLIGILDFFVFDRVCKMLARWISEGKEVVPISVNFSRYTLAEQDFLARLQEVLINYPIEKKWVIIEVTESVKGIEGMNLLALIDSLRAAGFIVSIDDFGVNFANLSLFSSANFDELKIDKALVGSIVTNQKTQMVIESIANICFRMGIQVVTEGVETEEQFRVLKQIGCDQAQGYLFSKPLPIQEYEERFLHLPASLHG